jgi:hypothetical protein
MPYKVALRKNATSEVKIVPSDEDWDEVQDFLWTEGNFACDCNRADFFGEEDNYPCTETAFTALYAELPDGRKITLDDEP